MKMTIDEKIENFRSLLRHSYQAQKKERFLIDSEIIVKSNEFNLRELKDVICQSLVNDGSLREQPSFLSVPSREEELTLESLGDNKYAIKSGFGYEFVVNKNKLAKRQLSDASNNPLWDIPVDTQWEDVTIKFKDAEKVEILIRNKHLAHSGFKEMRFGKNKPDKHWTLLHLLAVIYAATEQMKVSHSVSASVEDLAYSLCGGRIDEKAKSNVHTIKKNLSAQLNQIFGMDYQDPFEDYSQWGYYKSKFKLEPESELRRENVYEVGGKFNENTLHNMGDAENNENDDDYAS